MYNNNDKMRLIDDEQIEIYDEDSKVIISKGFRVISLSLEHVDIRKSYQVVTKKPAHDPSLVENPRDIEFVQKLSISGAVTINYDDRLHTLNTYDGVIVWSHSSRIVNLELNDNNNNINSIHGYKDHVFISAFVPDNIISGLYECVDNDGILPKITISVEIPCYTPSLYELDRKDIFLSDNLISPVAIRDIIFDNFHPKNRFDYIFNSNRIDDKILSYHSKGVRNIVKLIVDEVGAHVKNNTILLSKHEVNIDVVFEIIEELYHAVNQKYLHDEEASYGPYFCNNLSEQEILAPWVIEKSRVNISELNEVLNKYVQITWLNSPALESYMLNAYVSYCIGVQRSELERYNIYYKAGSCNVSSCKSSVYLLFNRAMFYTSYCLPICGAIYAMSYNYVLISILLLAHVLRKVFLDVVMYKEKQNILALFLSLIDLKRFVSASMWSPSSLLKKVLKLERDINIPELAPFVNKIKKRDPNMFSVL